MTEPHPVPPEGTPPTVPQLDVRAAEPPAAATPPPTGGFADRPPGYPSALVWLRAGILRDWRGVLGAFFATWFYLPVALLLAFWGGLVLAVSGLFAGGLGADDQLPQVLRDAPLLGPLLEAFLTRTGGALGGVVGFVVGFLGGFLAVLVVPWLGADAGPLTWSPAWSAGRRGGADRGALHALPGAAGTATAGGLRCPSAQPP